MLRLILIAGLAMFGTPIQAAPVTHVDGLALREICADGTAYFNYGRCAGFILAAHDAAILRDGAAATICVAPQDIISEVMIIPVIAHLAAPAIDLSQPGVTLVQQALANAFPCAGEE